MKNLIYICLFLFAGTIMSQEKPKNVSEETTVKTTKTNNGEKITESKVKVTTREEQNIEFDEKDKNKTDQNIIDSPTKITKTLEIDDNKNQAYDSKVEIAYYEFDGRKYNFTKNDTGFLITSDNKNDAFKSGSIIKASKENHYLFNAENHTGIGYFNSEGNFITEYYNPKTGVLEKEVFILVN